MKNIVSVHITDNQQLENRHFKHFFGCFISYTRFPKTTQNFKTSTPKNETMIEKTL